MTDQPSQPERPHGRRRAERSSRRPQRISTQRSAPPRRAARAERAAAATTTDGARRRGGARALRVKPAWRRTRSLPGSLGMTFLAALVPGSGYLYAGRRALGAVVLAAWLAMVAAVVWYFGRDLRGTSLDLAFDPVLLKVAALLMVLGIVVWAFVVFTSHRLVRPRERTRATTVAGYVAVGVITVVLAAPVAVAARYALVQADVVETVFAQAPDSATTPENATEADPWAGQDRVNILLLGGDGGEDRTGVRTDTVILLSVETKTGKATTFSLPRNMLNAQFPTDSPLHDLYPDGFATGQGDEAFDMLNAIYSQVPELHPGVLGKTDNEGADAVKEAVSGSLGLPVDYYLLVNLKGFQEVVDAIGGITVNINEPVAINGNTDAGIPPTDYLDPGPDQKLDGFKAMWFARGRYGSDDYARMDRQRCAVDALIKAADPMTLVSRYIALAQAGKEIVYTDIPRKLAPAFADLLLEVQGAKVKSVVFKASDQFNSADPDFDYVQQVVQDAFKPPKKRSGAESGGGSGSGGTGGGSSDSDSNRVITAPENACAYNPVDGAEVDSASD